MTKIDQNPHNITFPPTATFRPSPWVYVGWVKKDSKYVDYAEAIAAHISAGEANNQVREVDEYDTYAVEWYRPNHIPIPLPPNA